MRSWQRANKVERLAAGWWLTIAVVGCLSAIWKTPELVALAGFLMIGLGILLAANYDGVAERLGHERNATHWRISGGVLAVIGAGWATALGHIW